MGREDVRVCRVIFSYPTSEYPGVGLPAYFLSKFVRHPTLHLGRRFPGVPREAPSHVQVKLLQCPNPAVSGDMPVLERIRRFALKGYGVALFTLRAVPAILSYRPRILHLHTHLPILLAVIGRLLSARVIISVHGTDLLALQRSRMLRSMYRTLASEVWHVSESMAEPLAKLLPDMPLYHVPSGVDLTLFQPGGPVRKHQLVTVGTLKWQKGYPVLIRAFAMVADSLPEYRLLIVGDGDERTSLENLVKAEGLEERVDLLGNRTQEEIAQILGESETFVLASVSEGFPKVLLEALACGTPLIATDVGSCGQLVRDYGVGVVVPPDSAEELAGAILEMSTDSEFRQQCAARAGAAAAAFDWEKAARIAESNYARVIGRDRSRRRNFASDQVRD